MKTFTREVKMKAPENRSLFLMNKIVKDIVLESGIQEGLVYIGSLRDTSIFMDTDRPDEEGLREAAYLLQLRNIVPYTNEDCGGGFPVNLILMRQLLGKDVMIPITLGKLHLDGNDICYFDNYLSTNNYNAEFLIKIIGK